MLDAIEEALDEIAHTVQPAVVAALGFAIRTWRDDDLRAIARLCHERVGIVAPVRNNGSRAQMLTNSAAQGMSAPGLR